MHRVLGCTCLFRSGTLCLLFEGHQLCAWNRVSRAPAAYNLAAHTSLLLLLLVVLLELRALISVREGTWSHANNIFLKPLRRKRKGEHRLADVFMFFREHRPLCWTPAVTSLSLVCLVCALALVLPSLSCCGGCAGHRCLPKAVARALDSLCSKELPVHLFISCVPSSLFLLLCSAQDPLPPSFSHADAPSPSPTLTSLCSCSAPALLAIPSPLFPVPFSLHGGAGIFLCPFVKDCVLSRGSSWLHF